MIDKNEIEVRIKVYYKGEELTWDVVGDDTYFDVAERVIKNVSKRLKLYPDETWFKSEVEAQNEKLNKEYINCGLHGIRNYLAPIATEIELTYNEEHKESEEE